MKIQFVKNIVLLLFVILTFKESQGAIWQWSTVVSHNGRETRAFLYIPPTCKKIKAILFSQNNMEEHSILENAKFREDMGKLGVAEVWVSPGYDLFFNFNQGAGETFDKIIDELAKVSGYSELSKSPFIGMGHSAAASSPYYMAAWKPQRALAAISVSGQWPYFRHPTFAPDIWGNRSIDFIPCLETMGEYESAENWSNEGLKERSEHPKLPLSMLACPAEGHFSASSEKCAYIALYIKKVMKYRIGTTDKMGNVALKQIDPEKSGWLVERWKGNKQPLAKPARLAAYKGNPKDAFWFFDKELAIATFDYQQREKEKRKQLVGFLENGIPAIQRNTHQQINLKFSPLSDGITFIVKPAFYDQVPQGSPRPPMWSSLKSGETIKHSASRDKLQVEVITGPVVKLDDTTFQVHAKAGFPTDKHSYELWFAAKHPGDNYFAAAVQQAQMVVPPLNVEGSLQHISFLPIANQNRNAGPIKLKATSDMGTVVRFFILEGPAQILNGDLIIKDIPPRTKFPIRVSVVAWQYGKSTAPKIRTAEQVIQTFLVEE